MNVTVNNSLTIKLTRDELISFIRVLELGMDLSKEFMLVYEGEINERN